ncbi:hypothetical protein KBB12_03240 [Candidatus Woesebacteria bacterium]|nr:hypothetical protein [Candidatus Woesebacteria bacterium]
MLLIFCGDNTVQSRDALTKKKQELIATERQIKAVDAGEIMEIIKSGGSDAIDLFAGAPIYETSNLIPTLRKSFVRKTKEQLRTIAKDPTIELLDWESKSAYDLGIDKDKFTFVHDYKMSESTFTLLPTIIPGNKEVFLAKLQALTEFQPIELTFSMIVRHFKLMLALSAGLKPKDSPYLIRVAQSSMRHWSADSLLKFYHRLLSTDLNVKTGRNTPLSLKDQLEILASFLL